MSFPYRKVLVIGATSGIGEALAARLVQEKSRVIVVGRRKERLDAFVDKYGKDNASAMPFDVLELDKIPSFAARFEAVTNSVRSTRLIDSASSRTTQTSIACCSTPAFRGA